MEEQVNLDKEYLKNKIKSTFTLIDEKENIFEFVYKQKTFFAFYCGDDFPMIGILSDEKEKYPHFIYSIKNNHKTKEFAFLCLYIKEDLIVHNLNYKEKVDYIFSQYIRLMNLSKSQQEKEIIKEFQYHWKRSCTQRINSMVSPDNKLMNRVKLFYYKDNNKEGNVLSTTFPYDKKIKYTVINCLYIDLLDMFGLFPPNYKQWNSEYFFDIFFSLTRKRFNRDTSKLLNKLKIKKSITIILRLKELDGFEIGFKIIFKNSKKDFFENKLLEIENIIFLDVINMTIEQSLNRNGQKPIPFNNILVIGVGSLGSYVLRELPKLGTKRITIVDDDILTYDNISRHALGDCFSEHKKVDSLKILLESEYKQITIDSIDKHLSSKNIDEIVDVKRKYDLVLVLTGNEDLQFLINKYIISLDKFIPTIFCWMEANSVGSHALLMKDKESGCYNCILESNLSYLDSNHPFVKYNGCGGTYTHYGINILLETTSMLIKILNEFNNINQNTFFSYKMESVNIPQVYLTEKYNQDKIGINVLKSIKMRGCKECGRL